MKLHLNLTSFRPLITYTDPISKVLGNSSYLHLKFVAGKRR